MVADLIRKKLGLTEKQLSMACILQGGTWQAGRVIAQKLRKDGGPPVSVRSDGTVF
jgi:hypothetical protein